MKKKNNKTTVKFTELANPLSRVGIRGHDRRHFEEFEEVDFAVSAWTLQFEGGEAVNTRAAVNTSRHLLNI